MNKINKPTQVTGTPRVEITSTKISADLAAEVGWFCEAVHGNTHRPHATVLVLITINKVELDSMHLCPAHAFQATTGVGY